MERSEEHYDSASTIFSPDGRLFQVEYARQAIGKGTPSIGLKFADGVLLLVYKETPTALSDLASMEKIFQIDDHIACAASGLMPDARHLVDLARDEAQTNKITYNEQIPVKILVQQICDYAHLFTQFDGVRPFGVTLIVAGVDHSGRRLYVTDPSGASIEYKAICEGEGSQKAMAFLKTHYTVNLSFEKAVDLGMQTLQKTSKKKISLPSLDVAVITVKNRFRKLSESELKPLLGKHL